MSQAVFPVLPGMRTKLARKVLAPPVAIRTTPSRREYRARDALYPLYLYNLSFEVLRAGAEAELQTLVGFFNSRGGSFDDFLLNDPDDNAAAAQLFGTGNGTQTAFQLVRNYGGFVEPVYGVQGTPQVFVNDVLQASGYTIDTKALVTFTPAPANGATLKWTGSFYQRVRFLRDELDFEKFVHLLWEARQVELRTVPP